VLSEPAWYEGNGTTDRMKTKFRLQAMTIFEPEPIFKYMSSIPDRECGGSLPLSAAEDRVEMLFAGGINA